METIPRILIVEDLVEYQNIFQKYIKRLGYSYKIAASPKEAEEILSIFSFHVVLLDLRLEDEDRENKEGFKVLQMLSKLDEGTKVILQSAHANLNDANRALGDYRSHLVGFIEKNEMKLDETLEQIRSAAIQAQNEFNHPNRLTLNMPSLLGESKLQEVTKELGKVLNLPPAQIEADIEKLLKRLLLELFPLLPSTQEAKISLTEDNLPTVRMQTWSKRLGEPVEAWFSTYNIMASLVQPINENKFKHRHGYKSKVREVFDQLYLPNLGGAVYILDDVPISQFVTKTLA